MQLPPPPPRRCPDPPRARACRPGAWCRPSSWRSWPRGRSWKPSPGSRASCPCACGPDAPGPQPWVSRYRSPGPSAPASPGNPRPCRSARCCAAPRWPPWSRHPPRCARPSPDPPRRSSARTQSNTAVWTSWGRRARVRRQPGMVRHPFPPLQSAGTPVATGNPSTATPAHAQSRYPRSSPPGAYGSSARVAPMARPSWPRNRAGSSPRQRRRSRPRSAPTAGGRKTHDLASAASPTSPPSSPPDDPSAVPSPSANPPVKSEHQRIRPGRLRPVPTSSTGCYATWRFAKSDSMIRISTTLKCRLKAATMPSESLLGIAGDISASTCTELYSGKWVHTTYSGCG